MARRKAEELEDFGTASDDAAGPGAKRRRTMVRTTALTSADAAATACSIEDLSSEILVLLWSIPASKVALPPLQ